MIQEGNNEKDGRLATHNPRYNMHSWSLLSLLPSNFFLLLVCEIPVCGEPYLGSSVRRISDSLRRVSSFYRKIEACQMVLAGYHNYCYRSIALDLPCVELLFRSLSRM